MLTYAEARRPLDVGVDTVLSDLVLGWSWNEPSRSSAAVAGDGTAEPGVEFSQVSDRLRKRKGSSHKGGRFVVYYRTGRRWLFEVSRRWSFALRYLAIS